MVETARAFEIAEGLFLLDSDGDWTIMSEPVEAWSDVGAQERCVRAYQIDSVNEYGHDRRWGIGGVLEIDTDERY